ncbi:MAG TPA: MoaD/ThiS family protein [candidate division Zixibacteria bacterium]|nr:MoaD/ThiS family protein [candidate division Zixibacteria bacterium]
MKIRTIGFAEKLLGFKEKKITFEGKKKLSEIIDFTDIPLNLIAIIINEKAALKDHVVQNNDDVIITQIVAGG